MSLRLELQLEEESHAPGDVVRGTVLVLEGGGSRALAVSLSYREQSGEHYEDTPVTLAGGDVHTGDLTTGASYPFEIPLPDDALPNFKSKHGSSGGRSTRVPTSADWIRTSGGGSR